jgi:hypothetical protein
VHAFTRKPDSQGALALKQLGAELAIGDFNDRDSQVRAMIGFELSMFLRYVESGAITGPNQAWLLYQPASFNPSAIGDETRRVITEWAAAPGKDLKTRARAVEVKSRPMVGMN